MARQKIEETVDFLGNTVRRGDILYTATKHGLELLVVQEIYATDSQGNLMTQPPYGFEDPKEPGKLYMTPTDSPNFKNPAYLDNTQHLALVENLHHIFSTMKARTATLANAYSKCEVE